jgi:hypothetical protein
MRPEKAQRLLFRVQFTEFQCFYLNNRYLEGKIRLNALSRRASFRKIISGRNEGVLKADYFQVMASILGLGTDLRGSGRIIEASLYRNSIGDAAGA